MWANANVMAGVGRPVQRCKVWLTPTTRVLCSNAVKIHFASKFCVLLYWQHYCTALEQWASAKVCGVQQRAPPIFGRAAITLGVSEVSEQFLNGISAHIRPFSALQ